MTNESREMKLPGGCILADRKADTITMINTKQLNIIPFRRYRLDPEPVDMTDDDEPLHWTELVFITTGIGTLMVGCLGSGIGAAMLGILGAMITMGFFMAME